MHDHVVEAGDSQVRIHPPVWARAWILVFQPFWIWIAFEQSDGAVSWLFTTFGVALGGRLFVMGAVGTSDGRLTVRNEFTTRTFRRDQLADAVVDRADVRSGGWTVWLTFQDGSRHRVRMTEVPFRPGSNGTLTRQAAQLRAWIRAPDRA